MNKFLQILRDKITFTNFSMLYMCFVTMDLQAMRNICNNS